MLVSLRGPLQVRETNVDGQLGDECGTFIDGRHFNIVFLFDEPQRD